MVDTNIEAAPLRQDQVAEQEANGGNGKVEASSPRKRERSYNEDDESAGASVKRVKGVAPIKTE